MKATSPNTFQLDRSKPFHAVLIEMAEMHDKKSKDYGTNDDPLANIRASERFNIPAWLGAILRQNDKIKRIEAFVKNGKLANESLSDSLIDNVVYAAIALQLYREKS